MNSTAKIQQLFEFYQYIHEMLNCLDKKQRQVSIVVDKFTRYVSIAIDSYAQEVFNGLNKKWCKFVKCGLSVEQICVRK